MKKAHDILQDIWQALTRKESEVASGLSKPNEILSSFTCDLGRLGECLRYKECLNQLPPKEVHGHILRFVQAARKAAQKQTKDPVQMHRIAREIFYDLGLTTLLMDARIFFPERTRHLYQILVALDLKIAKSSSGVSSLNPHVLAYYENIVQYFYLLLDSSSHQNISEELSEELTKGFIDAVSKAAHEGKPGVLHRQNAVAIFNFLDLVSLLPKFGHEFPEKLNANGLFIISGEKKEDSVA